MPPGFSPRLAAVSSEPWWNALHPGADPGKWPSGTSWPKSVVTTRRHWAAVNGATLTGGRLAASAVAGDAAASAAAPVVARKLRLVQGFMSRSSSWRPRGDHLGAAVAAQLPLPPDHIRKMVGTRQPRLPPVRPVIWESSRRDPPDSGSAA